MSLQNGIANIPPITGPLYMQVAASLRAKIWASEWTSRAPLPNEVHLARDIGVSVGTLRKALELLEDENLIERRQGLGTFVVEATLETELECFSHVMVDGAKVRAQRGMWTATIGDASAIESTALSLKPGAAVYRLETMWNAANGATACEHVTVSVSRFPGLPHHVNEGDQFLFPVYRLHYREAISRVTEALTCVNADQDMADKLYVPQGKALLQLSRIAFNYAAQPVEFSQRTMLLADAEFMVTMD